MIARLDEALIAS